MAEASADRELQAIRRMIQKAMEPEAVPDNTSTHDLVGALVVMATREHRHLQRIRRQCLAAGAGQGGGVEELVRGLLAELERWREGSAKASAADAREAWANQRVREALIGDSGAVEIPLTDSEIVDLVHTGATFTEVGGPDGIPDLLVHIVDITGKLRRCAEVILGDSSRSTRQH